jgi:hypothetical protein
MAFKIYFSVFIMLIIIGGIMITLLETGRRIGKHRMKLDPDNAHQGFGALEASVFGLLGLMIAFTFSGAVSRLDQRRMDIIEEANAIGTAYLRIDLLSQDAQPEMRKYFRDYLEARIEVYLKVPDIQAVTSAQKKAELVQGIIWETALADCNQSENNAASMLLLPAINSMFDISSSRMAIAVIHQPTSIFVILIILALVCSLFAGYGMAAGKSRSWVHFIGFTAAFVISIYVILDMEYPRIGIINIHSMDYLITDLRNLMK